MLKIFHAAAIVFAAAALAAAPARWSVDVSRLEPVRIEAYAGDTIVLEARLVDQGRALDLVGDASFLWQTNGMTTWWQAAASYSNSTVRTVFTPQMAQGATDVRFFFQTATAAGSDYRAAGAIVLRPSPGANPAVAPLPEPGETLDLALYTVLNAPWCSLEDAQNAVTAGIQAAGESLQNFSNQVVAAYALKSDLPTDYLVASNLTGLASTGYVDAAVAAISVPDVSGLASTGYVDAAVAAISIPDVSGLASTQYVDNKVASISPPDLTAYALETNVASRLAAEAADRAAADSAIAEAIDRSALAIISNAAAIAAIPAPPDLAAYALKSDLPADYLVASNLTGLASIGYVDAAIAAISIPDVSGLASTQYVDNKVASISPPDLTAYALETNVASRLAAEAADRAGADSALAEAIDRSALAIISNAAAIAAIPAPPDLAAYALKSDLPADYLVASNLTGLASIGYVDAAVAAISIPDVSGLASTLYVDNKVASISPPDLTAYALETNVASRLAAEAADRAAADAAARANLNTLATNLASLAASISPPDLSPYALETNVTAAIAAEAADRRQADTNLASRLAYLERSGAGSLPTNAVIYVDGTAQTVDGLSLDAAAVAARADDWLPTPAQIAALPSAGGIITNSDSFINLAFPDAKPGIYLGFGQNADYPTAYFRANSLDNTNTELKVGAVLANSVKIDSFIEGPEYRYRTPDMPSMYSDRVLATESYVAAYVGSHAPTGGVTSVNGKTGAVQLNASDVNALGLSGGYVDFIEVTGRLGANSIESYNSITANNGSISAYGNITSSHGNISAPNGDVISSNGVLAARSELAAKQDKLLSGYAAAPVYAPIAATDTVSSAVAKLDAGLRYGAPVLLVDDPLRPLDWPSTGEIEKWRTGLTDGNWLAKNFPGWSAATTNNATALVSRNRPTGKTSYQYDHTRFPNEQVVFTSVNDNAQPAGAWFEREITVPYHGYYEVELSWGCLIRNLNTTELAFPAFTISAEGQSVNIIGEANSSILQTARATLRLHAGTAAIRIEASPIAGKYTGIVFSGFKLRLVRILENYSPTGIVSAPALAWQPNGNTINVTSPSAGTLSADLDGWIDGQVQTCIIHLATGATVDSSIRLAGYAEWPRDTDLVAAAIRIGNIVIVNLITALVE